MTITAESPRGGVVEYIDGVSYVLLLRCKEIERFEDKHRGVFDLWDGFFGGGKKPTSTEVHDILALALVGGGKTDAQADKIVLAGGAESLLHHYQLAQAVLGVAFMPDIGDSKAATVKKKNTTRPPNAALTSAS
tara:strand:+ start:9308 stop:9709 length:402 start_codon:yes stop_codon:yes gene_type:complete